MFFRTAVVKGHGCRQSAAADSESIRMMCTAKLRLSFGRGQGTRSSGRGQARRPDEALDSCRAALPALFTGCPSPWPCLALRVGIALCAWLSKRAAFLGGPYRRMRIRMRPS